MNILQWFGTYSSSMFGVASIFCWVFALFPQIYENYKIKRVSALSPVFIALWICGDLSNMLGCILTHQSWTMIWLSIYFCTVDLMLIGQYIYYGTAERIDTNCEISDSTSSDINRDIEFQVKPSRNVLISIILWANTLSCVMGESPHSKFLTNSQSHAFDSQDLGTIFAWVSAIMYCTSRIPQIYKNWKRHSVEGLSLCTFYAAFFGNIFYSLSIIMVWKHGSGNENLLPFLIGSTGTLLLDMFILFVQGRNRVNDSYEYRSAQLHTSHASENGYVHDLANDNYFLLPADKSAINTGVIEGK